MYRSHASTLVAFAILGWASIAPAATTVASSKIWLVNKAATGEKLTVKKGEYLRLTFEHIQQSNLVGEGGGPLFSKDVSFTLSRKDAAGKVSSFGNSSSDYLVLEAQHASVDMRATSPGAINENYKWIHQITYFIRANRGMSLKTIEVKAMEGGKPYALGSVGVEVVD